MYLVVVVCFIVNGVIAVDEKVSHPFVCADIAKKHVAKFDANGEQIWSYTAHRLHDVWGLKNGNVLIAGPSTGVQEVSPDKKVVWQYKVPKGEGIYSCQPLPNGDVMVAVASKTNRIVEVNREGTVTKTISLKAKGAIRLVRKTKSGNYIVAARREKKVQVYDSEGKLIRDIAVPGVYLAFELENRNILIGCGDGHKILEIDPNDKVVWQIDENELPGNPLRLIAGMQRLPNGNTVVVNYGGHGHLGKQPQIFEVTRDKKVVWQVSDTKKFATPVHVQLLDAPGLPEKGELYR